MCVQAPQDVSIREGTYGLRQRTTGYKYTKHGKVCDHDWNERRGYMDLEWHTWDVQCIYIQYLCYVHNK